MNKYIKALKAGKEIVIVSSDENSNSAIFYNSSDNKTLYTFSLHFGLFPREYGKDVNVENLVKHFETMEKENALIFIRGLK